MKRVATSVLGTLLVGHLWPCVVGAADANWRRPLTFKDSGFYSGIDGERRFDFYVLQWNVQRLPLPWDVRKSDRLVKELRRQGKFAIARLYLWKTHDEQARPIEEYYREVDAVLEKIDTTNLYGVSLSEENIHWKGHGEVLEKLYDYVKGKWPHLLVFQWFSNQPPDVIDSEKADGYIIDPYGFRERKFLPFLKKNLSFGKPVINVVFIANQGGTWNWSPAHFKAFEDQWRICREHDVPVGFYCIGPVSTKLNRLTLPWETDDAMTRALFEMSIEKAADADVGGPAWRRVKEMTDEIAKRSKKPGIVIRDLDHGQKDFEYYDDLTEARNYAAEFTVRDTAGLVTVTQTTDGVRADLLDWEGDTLFPRLTVRRTDQAYDMRFIYKIESPFPVSEIVVAAKQYANRDNGSKAYLTVSRDGQKWEVSRQAQIVFDKMNDRGTRWLSVFGSYDASTFQHLHSFWVRLRWVKSAVDAHYANSLYKFVIRGRLDTKGK